MTDLFDIFICDECDTLATLSVAGDTIQLNKCKCLTRKDN